MLIQYDRGNMRVPRRDLPAHVPETTQRYQATAFFQVSGEPDDLIERVLQFAFDTLVMRQAGPRGHDMPEDFRYRFSSTRNQR